jgi:hypothetical protein
LLMLTRHTYVEVCCNPSTSCANKHPGLTQWTRWTTPHAHPTAMRPASSMMMATQQPFLNEKDHLRHTTSPHTCISWLCLLDRSLGRHLTHIQFCNRMTKQGAKEVGTNVKWSKAQRSLHHDISCLTLPHIIVIVMILPLTKQCLLFLLPSSPCCSAFNLSNRKQLNDTQMTATFDVPVIRTAMQYVCLHHNNNKAHKGLHWPSKPIDTSTQPLYWSIELSQGSGHAQLLIACVARWFFHKSAWTLY